MNNLIDWKVRTEKPEYGPGDTVKIIGTFLSKDKETKIWMVHTQFIHVGAYDFPPTILPRSVQLEPDKEYEGIIEEISVNDDLAPGEYSARVGLEMSRGVLDTKEVNFRIVGTPKPLDFRIILSRDMDGKEPKKVFISGDKEVYIKAVCDVTATGFSGTCLNPSGKEVTLAFKGATSSCLLVGEGAYKLSVTARAEGYKTKTRLDYFSVIKEYPVFKKFKNKDGSLSIKI